MKKILLVILLILALIITMVPAFAAGYPSNLPSVGEAEASVPLKSRVEVEHPGILPTSPFYFIKELGRGFKRALTVSRLSKAEYELQITNQKAAELGKIRELDPKNSKAIKTALDNYSEDIAQLNADLEAIGTSYNNNPRLGNLLNRVAKETTIHSKAFEELKADHDSIKGEIEEVQISISRTLVNVPVKFKESAE
jgi:hypothetical protein